MVAGGKQHPGVAGRRSRATLALLLGPVILLTTLIAGTPRAADARPVTFNVAQILTPAAPLPAAPSDPGTPPARLRIPRLGVDAAVEVRGLDPDGTMQTPVDPFAVAWYPFTAPLADTGNVVMAGHVDADGVGPAVFWRLRELRPEDRIEVLGAGGQVIDYQVTAMAAVNAETAPVAEIIGPTQTPSLTLITCGGLFNRASHQYEARLVVRATRDGT